VAAAAGLLVLVAWASNPREVLRAMAGARWPPILAAVALVAVDRVLMAYRWLALLAPVPAGQRPRLGQLLRVFLVSTFVGTFLPAGIGGDAVRAFGLARLDVPPPAAVASVVLDRALGVLSLLVMALAGLLLVGGTGAHPGVRLGLALAGAACLGMALVVFHGPTARLAVSAGGLAPPRLARAGRSLVEAVQRYRTHHAALFWVLVASIAVQALRTLQAYFLGRALGIDAPLTAYFAFVPLIVLVMQVPVSVNGIGTSQAAFVWFFGQAGVGRAEAFALSVLFLALGVVGNLPGGLLVAWQGSGTDGGPASGHDGILRD
jgi:hypothetical protein